MSSNFLSVFSIPKPLNYGYIIGLSDVDSADRFSVTLSSFLSKSLSESRLSPLSELKLSFEDTLSGDG